MGGWEKTRGGKESGLSLRSRGSTLPVGHLRGGVVQDLGLAVEGQVHVLESSGAVAEGGGGSRARRHCTGLILGCGLRWDVMDGYKNRDGGCVWGEWVERDVPTNALVW